MKIYHYLSSEFALKNLENRRIKISKFDELNDPFELVAANHFDSKQRSIWEEWKRAQAETWGLVCFSKTWRNPVLWSHYADRHRGICLGFEVPLTLINEVRYTKNRLNMDVLRLYEQGKLTAAHMAKVVRTKYVDWKYEREVRVFARLDEVDEKSGLYFHEFDHEMVLTDVFIGPLCKITEADIRVSLRSEDSHANVVKTRIAHKTFDVVQENSKS